MKNKFSVLIFVLITLFSCNLYAQDLPTSKLPEVTTLSESDLFYVSAASEGRYVSRRLKISNFFASDAEAIAGTVSTKAVTPAALAAVFHGAAVFYPAMLGYGAVGNGVADDTAVFVAINTACGSSACIIDLGGKSYVATKLTLSSNRAIRNGTLIFKDGETGDFIYIAAKDNIILENLTINGNATALTFTTGSTVGTRVGIQLLAASSNILLNNVTIKNFDKAGVEASNIGDDTGYGTGLRIIGGKYINNYYGWHFDTTAQYIQGIDSSIGGNRFGIYDIAGSMTGSALNILYNVDGVYLGTSANDGHGSISNSKINHQIQYAIITDGVLNGFTFNGSHIFYGDVYLKNSSGIHIINGEMASVDFYFEGGGYNTVKNMMLGVVPVTVTRNYNSSVSQTEFKNNRYMATGTLHASCDLSSEQTAARARLVNDIYSIVTPSKVKALWFFDKSSTDKTLADASVIGGATAHPVTLRNGSLTEIASSTFTTGMSDIGRYMTTDATHLFNAPDSDDFSFGNGSTDTAGTWMVLAQPGGTDVPLLSKYDATTASPQLEWVAPYINSQYLKCKMYDMSAGASIGRASPNVVSLTVPSLFTVTYDGSAASSGIKLFINGTRVDNADWNAGSYTAMENTTSLVGSYNTSADGSLSISAAKYYVVLMLSEALTEAQVARLDNIIRAYVGISTVTW
jgi:hypothetical protein